MALFPWLDIVWKVALGLLGIVVLVFVVLALGLLGIIVLVSVVLYLGLGKCRAWWCAR